MVFKILVTGGAGFVGSHLCERLVSMGHDVTSLDNYFTGSRENHVPGVEYIFADTMDILRQFALFGGGHKKFDLVYHLGEYSRVEQSFTDIGKVMEYNSEGTRQVLEFVRLTKAKLIYAGSSTKYADRTEGYVQSPYAWTKATNTDLVKMYGEWENIQYAITYFYNVYGKREIKTGQYATLIAKYAEQMRLGETQLPIVQPGTQLRNFTHIDDIVDALILVGAKGVGDEFGIGSDDAYSILEIVKMFQVDHKWLPPRPGNRMSAPVISDKTKALGWQPRRNLPDYIKTLRENGWKK